MPERPATRRVNAVFSHVAAPNEGGFSFLDLLVRRFPYHTREEWIARIRAGAVRLGDEPAEPDSPVIPGARLQYRVEDYEEPAVPIDFREIVTSGDLALVHKPAGLPVHKTGKIFVHVLAGLYRRFRGDDAWTPLNRLDAETSGIVAFARGRDALRRFSPGTPGSRWTKTYLAVVEGVLEAGGLCEAPLAGDSVHAIRSRMVPHPAGKPASTWYRPVESRDGKTLVLVQPVTGRKHQIRAHLAHLGFPVVGDKVYSLEGRYYLKRLERELDEEDLAALQAPHQLLHAFALDVRDAEGEGISGMDLELPTDFLRFFPGLTRERLHGMMYLPDFPERS